jgi:sugar lactone lactonase YvrE
MTARHLWYKLLATGIAAAAVPAVALAGPVVAPGYSLDVLVRPSLTHGVHGMKVGPDGALYAGDILGLTIWRIDLRSGAATPFVPAPLGMADDLAFSAAGVMAWTHILDGRVYSRTPDGKIHLIATGLPGINSIGFGRGGQLYATQIGGADRLLELDPNGARPARLLLDGIGGLNGFQIDSHNVLWGPEGKRGNIVRIDLDTLQRSVVATGFIWPTGVALDSHGVPFVSDLTAGTLSRIDRVNGRKTLVHQFLPGIDNLTIGPDDRIYVSSPGDNSIYRVNPASGAVEALRRGQLSVPGGVAVGPGRDGSQVFVADVFDWKRVDPRTGRVFSMGRHVGRPIVQATSIRASGSHLILSQWNSNIVVVVDSASGQVLRTVKDVEAPQDAVEDVDGILLVALRDKGQLIAIDRSGQRRIVADGFAEPVGLSLAGRSLYLTETGRGILWRINLADGARTRIAVGLDRPEGVEYAADGSLYVVEAGAGRVIRIDAARRRTTIATGLPLGIRPGPDMPQAWVVNGIAASGDGTLYVTADGDSSLLSLKPVSRSGGR